MASAGHSSSALLSIQHSQTSLSPSRARRAVAIWRRPAFRPPSWAVFSPVSRFCSPVFTISTGLESSKFVKSRQTNGNNTPDKPPPTGGFLFGFFLTLLSFPVGRAQHNTYKTTCSGMVVGVILTSRKLILQSNMDGSVLLKESTFCQDILGTL